MALPHESFSPQFTSKLKKALDLARKYEAKREVWLLFHFDQDYKSLETYQSQSDMGASYYQFYQKTLLEAHDAPGKTEKASVGFLAKKLADYAMENVPAWVQRPVAMHAEETFIQKFPGHINDWVSSGQPEPKNVCVYLSHSPCQKSPAKLINNKPYALGCLSKITALANIYAHAQYIFTIYYDTVFENTTLYKDKLASSSIDNLVNFAAMPDALR